MITKSRATLDAVLPFSVHPTRRILSAGAVLAMAALLLPHSAKAQTLEDEEVLPGGSEWEYLLYAPDDGFGLFTPADPSTADPDFYTTWQLGGASYNGPAFETGTAPLGYDVINGAPNVTDIWGGRNGTVSPASGSRYSAYFRTTFTPTADTSSLRFSGITDDGAIIYINGAEVARTTNMDAVAADTWDLFATATGSEDVAVTIDVAGLSLPGGTEATVSVSLHQQSVTSSDMGMNFRIATLVPEPPSFGKDLAAARQLKATFETAAPAATSGDGDGGPDDNLPWRTAGGSIQAESGLLNPPPTPGNALYVNNGQINFIAGNIDLDNADNASVIVSIDMRVVDTSSGFEADDFAEAYIEGSNDGSTFARVADILPRMVGADPDPGPFKMLELPDGAYTTFSSVAGAIPTGVRTIRIVISAKNNSLSEHLFFDNICVAAQTAGAFRITEILYDRNADEFTLTWISAPGQVYSMYFDTDLGQFASDIDDSIAAADGADETTFGPFPNPAPGAPSVFFRIVGQ